MPEFTITVLPGDGIGSEVTSQGVKVLDSVGAKFKHQFQLRYAPVGGSAIDELGVPLPRETTDLCRTSDAVLLGAVGGPKWDCLPMPERPERAIASLRRELGIFVNLRPVKVFPQLVNCTPFKPGVIQGVDYVIVRGFEGGITRSKPRGLWQTARGKRAINTIRFGQKVVENHLRVVFQLARGRRGRLSLATQDNVLETSRLWKEVCVDLASEYQDVEVEYLYPDACAMELIRKPAHFDVVAVDNLLTAGLLNDQGAAMMGSLGMAPSAELNPRMRVREERKGPLAGVFGLYEPVHGSAPRHAGLNKVNPIATILSVSQMLRYSLNLLSEAEAVEEAINGVLDEDYRTYDIMEAGKKKVGTEEMGDLIARALREGK